MNRDKYDNEDDIATKQSTEPEMDSARRWKISASSSRWCEKHKHSHRIIISFIAQNYIIQLSACSLQCHAMHSENNLNPAVLISHTNIACQLLVGYYGNYSLAGCFAFSIYLCGYLLIYLLSDYYVPPPFAMPLYCCLLYLCFAVHLQMIRLQFISFVLTFDCFAKE